MKVLLLGAPREYAQWLGGRPAGPSFVSSAAAPVQAAHVFASDRAALKKQLTMLRRQLAPDGVVWVSWPKKASKVPTDITEDTVREQALPLDLVDIKVCAVSEVWSGLKLMIRKEARR